MQKLASILLATDFRPASMAATQATEKLAKAFASQVTVFHSLEQSWPISSQEHQAIVLQRLAEQNVNVKDLVIGIGSPAESILRKADELDVDLIVMGAGEMSRRQEFAVGPIAMAVIEQARQPVLAVRPGTPPLRFERILCPVDHSATSGRGLRNALVLAEMFNTHLVVLSVIPDVTWLTAAVTSGHLANAQSEYERQWRQEFDQFLAAMPPGIAKAQIEVRQGVVHDHIVNAAVEFNADLVVMGATGRTGLVRVLLGSTTRRVLERTPCSLLTVKQDDLTDTLFESELQHVQLLMGEGRALLSAGSADAALAKFRQVLRHNPFHAGAIAAIAEAHEKLGHADRAQYYRSRVQRLADVK
jgi:nucleotide-binding universal stress UspA family protein